MLLLRSRPSTIAGRWSVWMLALTLITSNLTLTWAQEESSDIPDRPDTEALLPETTVAFIQIDHFREMMAKMEESAGGRMMQHESVAPLVDGLWNEARTAYDDVREQVGLDLDDLLALPEGEMTFAVIAPRRSNPVFFLLLELGNEDGSLDRVLNRGREVIENESGETFSTTESDDGFQIESCKVENDVTMYFVRHENTILGCASPWSSEKAEEALNGILERWMGREVEKVRPLTDNRKFVTIMNRCLGNSELKPEARFFVDPITLAKSSLRGDFTSQAAINFLPVLGLDGLLGVGGSMLLSEEGYESVTHAHILLSNPRSGLLEVLAFRPTDYEPESWLPKDTVQYWTTSWDVPHMFEEIKSLVEMVNGEGVVDEFLEGEFKNETGLDFQEDILEQLSGRVTWAQWIEPPMRINSGTNGIAIGLKDPDRARETIEKIVARINGENGPGREDEPNLVAIDYQGVTIWCEPQERVDRREQRRLDRQAERREEGRPTMDLEVNEPSPAFAIIGDSLVFSPQSRGMLEHAIDTERGEFPALRDSEEFQDIHDQMARLLKNELPCAIFYQNPKDSIKMLLEVGKSSGLGNMLSTGAENNRYLAGIKRTLDENPLPEFEELEKFFTQAGGFATSDDTGYHFLMFQVKNEALDE